MTLNEIRLGPLAQALALLPARMKSDAAEIQVLATTLQESPNREQCQLPIRPGKCGPARGIAQFELGGGVRGVLHHPASRPHVLAVCAALGVEPTEQAIFDALPTQDDVLDCALARLLYWTDSRPLPAVGDVAGAWEYYLRNWRPGAYTRGSASQRDQLRKKWTVNYALAMQAVTQ